VANYYFWGEGGEGNAAAESNVPGGGEIYPIQTTGCVESRHAVSL